MTAIAIAAPPPTTPPTMAPVSELTPVENPESPESPDLGNEEREGSDLAGVVTRGKNVGLGKLVPVALGPVMVVEPPINAPGPISGLSESRRYKVTKAKTETKTPTPDGLRFDGLGIPKSKTLALPCQCAISTCQKG